MLISDEFAEDGEGEWVLCAGTTVWGGVTGRPGLSVCVL